MKSLKYLFSVAAFLLVALSASADKGGSISKRNELKEKAHAAYEAGNYKDAAAHLTVLVDSLKVDDPKLIYNLANIEMKAENLESAARRFSQLVNTPDREVRSLAEQHLGVMAAKDGKLDEALNHLKNSLRANPANEQARYNYELLKKQKEQQEKENESEDKDQQDEQKKDQQKNEDQQKQEGDKGEEKEDNKPGQEKGEEEKEGKEGEENKEEEGKKEKQEQAEQKEGEEGEEEKDAPKPGEEGEKEGEGQPQPQQFQEIDISEEKAKMILEALRNREAQYLQQRQRQTDKRQPNDRPTW